MKRGGLIGCICVLLGLNYFQQVAGQTPALSILQSSYFDGCSTVNVTARVIPAGNTYSFFWYINGSLLATVSLNGTGGIIVTSGNNFPRDQYNISNDPHFLSTPTEEYLSILTLKDLNRNETVQVTVEDDAFNRSVNVTPPSCIFPEDSFCTANCLRTSLCDNSFTKQCEDGTPVVQECPADVSTVVNNRCGREPDQSVLLGLTITGGIVALVGIVLIIFSCKYEAKKKEYASKIWKAGVMILGFGILLIGLGLAIGLSEDRKVLLGLTIFGGIVAIFGVLIIIVSRTNDSVEDIAPKLWQLGVLILCLGVILIGLGLAIGLSEDRIQTLLLGLTITGGIVAFAGVGKIIFDCIYIGRKEPDWQDGVLVLGFGISLIGIGLAIGLSGNTVALAMGIILAIAGAIIIVNGVFR